MSALGGILSLRGAPIDPRALGVLDAGLASLGPDGSTRHREPRLEMVHRSFAVDRASDRGRGSDIHRLRSRESREAALDSRQDFALRDPFPGSLVVAWNGRIDERSALCRRVGARQTVTDATLVAALYRCGGVAGLDELMGEFSLALWDADAARLVLAVDAFALRPLFVHRGAEHLYWSSRARPLLSAARLEPEIDEVGVAAFLTFVDAGRRTALRGIEMLPGASLMVVERGQITVRRTWSPVPNPSLVATLARASDAECEERFRDAFRSAVADRLRAAGPVYADLSGGLDSSSIVRVGDQILADGARVDPPARAESPSELTPSLHTVSYVYDESRSCDERRYIEAVERQRGRRGLHLSDADIPTLSPIPETLSPDLPSGQLPFQQRYAAQERAMRAVGSRVLLRGSGGDHVLWGEVPAAFELADHLAAGRPLQALRRAGAWSRQRREPLLQTLWQGAIWPLLPRRLRARTGFYHQLDGWFDADFVERVDLRDRLLGSATEATGLDLPRGAFDTPTRRLQWAAINGLGRYVGWELPLETGCVESRYPFLDRRVVELAMALPIGQMLRPGETRSVLRRALRGVLPEAVRTRTSKAGPDEAVYRGLTRESAWLGRLFDDARIARRRFVEPVALERAVAAARHGAPLNSPQLLRAIALEVWLRSLESASLESEFPSVRTRGRGSIAPSFEGVPPGFDGRLSSKPSQPVAPAATPGD